MPDFAKTAPDHEPTPRFDLDTGRRLDAKIGSSHSLSEIEISLGGVLAHPVGHNGQPAGKPIAGSHALCPTDAVLD